MPAYTNTQAKILQDLSISVTDTAVSLTAAAVIVAASAAASAAAVVAGGNATVIIAAIASEIEDEQSDYNKPNSRIFKPIAQTVHLCASFILHREGFLPLFSNMI